MTDVATEQLWDVELMLHRIATPEEVAGLRALGGAPHVTFGCLCGTGWWSAKNIALSPLGHYNGMRNIFYNGSGPECQCKSTMLVCIVPIDEAR